MKIFFIKRKSTGNLMGVDVLPLDSNGEYSADIEWTLVELKVEKYFKSEETFTVETKVWCSTSKVEALNVICQHGKFYSGKNFEYAEHKFDDLEIVEKEV
jgi:hypothetical protein